MGLPQPLISNQATWGPLDILQVLFPILPPGLIPSEDGAQQQRVVPEPPHETSAVEHPGYNLQI